MTAAIWHNNHTGQPITRPRPLGITRLDPSHALEALAPDGMAAPSLLLEASELVLRELGAALRDTGYATLLVDRESAGWGTAPAAG